MSTRPFTVEHLSEAEWLLLRATVNDVSRPLSLGDVDGALRFYTVYGHDDGHIALHHHDVGGPILRIDAATLGTWLNFEQAFDATDFMAPIRALRRILPNLCEGCGYLIEEHRGLCADCQARYTDDFRRIARLS